MGSLDGLHVQVDDAVFFLDLGVLGVGERTGLAVAEAGQIVFVAAKVLSLGFHFVRTESVVYDAPDDVVLLHFGLSFFFCLLRYLIINNKYI